MSDKKLKINVSFPKYDKHIYDFIKEQENPSAFVRKLVEAYMNGVLGNMMMQNQSVNIHYNHFKTHQPSIMAEEVVVDRVENVEDNEVSTGEFSLNYNQINQDQLNQINDLPF